MKQSEDNDPRIRDLIGYSGERSDSPRLTRAAVIRARRQVGNRDTIVFAFVRIWAVLAKILAPFFAVFGTKHAHAVAGSRPSGRRRAKQE